MIVFRAWDSKNKEMLYPNNENVFSSGHRNSFVIGGGGKAFCLSKRTEVLGVKIIQSTGYDDATGEDIYDGDIIESALKYLVFYDFDSAMFRASYGVSISDLMYIIESDIKPRVIGNKYETPDLLKIT